MKSRILPAFVFGLFLCTAGAQNKPDLTDSRQRTSYALGMDIMTTFQQQDVEVDTKTLLAGMADMFAGKPALTAEQKQAAITELAKAMSEKDEQKRKILAAANLKEGAAFLAANAKKEGVKIIDATAPDGSKAELQYQVLKSGSGTVSPTDSDIVEVHYEGRRIDGSVFDSSLARGTPATFGIYDVVPGWAVALKRMKVGDKWRLFIPPTLGYGEHGLPQLAPNSTLIFDLELLSFYNPNATKSGSATNPPPAAAK